eukprot:768600-Hanusia_phi.AAC.1
MSARIEGKEARYDLISCIAAGSIAFQCDMLLRSKLLARSSRLSCQRVRPAGPDSIVALHVGVERLGEQESRQREEVERHLMVEDTSDLAVSCRESEERTAASHGSSLVDGSRVASSMRVPCWREGATGSRGRLTSTQSDSPRRSP